MNQWMYKICLKIVAEYVYNICTWNPPATHQPFRCAQYLHFHLAVCPKCAEKLPSLDHWAIHQLLRCRSRPVIQSLIIIVYIYHIWFRNWIIPIDNGILIPGMESQRYIPQWLLRRKDCQCPNIAPNTFGTNDSVCRLMGHHLLISKWNQWLWNSNDN